MRKILLAIAAAATLAGGIAASTAPAQAKVNVFIGFGTPGYYDPGYYDPGYYDDDYYRPVYRVRHHARYHCHWRKVWHHHHWVRVKQCHRNHRSHGY